MKKSEAGYVPNYLGPVTTDSILVGKGTGDASAILQINSNDKGFLLPRMTTAQRTAIATPANGLMVYDTDLNTPFTYEGSSWIDSGNINGPGSSTDNALVRFDGTSGKVIQNSGAILDDSNNLTGVTSLVVGGSGSEASSLLTVNSTAQGMLPPRMTTAQRTAIVAPAEGLMVYDTDINDLFTYDGSAWVARDVTGPASSTDNAIVRFDGTSGNLIQNSTATLDDSGVLTTAEVVTPLITGSTTPLLIVGDATGATGGTVQVRSGAGTTTNGNVVIYAEDTGAGTDGSVFIGSNGISYEWPTQTSVDVGSLLTVSATGVGSATLVYSPPVTSTGGFAYMNPGINSVSTNFQIRNWNIVKNGGTDFSIDNGTVAGDGFIEFSNTGVYQINYSVGISGFGFVEYSIYSGATSGTITNKIEMRFLSVDGLGTNGTRSATACTVLDLSDTGVVPSGHSFLAIKCSSGSTHNTISGTTHISIIRLA